MRRALFVLCMLLAAGLVHGDEVTKPGTPTTGRPAPGNPITPVPVESRITSQVYVGEAAPDFELDGSGGRAVRLAHLKGYWVLLVFADRRADFAALKDVEPELRKLGVKPYGVCGDKLRALQTFVAQSQLPVTLLADVTGQVSQLYGLYDSRASEIRPGFVLVNRQGIVRMALLGQMLPYDEMLGLIESCVTGYK